MHEARKINIRLDGNVAIVDAANARLIAPLLTAESYQFIQAGGEVVGCKHQDVLGRLDGETFRFPAKLGRMVELD